MQNNRSPLCCGAGVYPVVIAILVTFARASVLEAATPWRFWNSADGLTESYSSVLALDREGHLIVRHGNVVSLSELDGYKVTNRLDLHWYGRLFFDSVGKLWTFDLDGIDISDRPGSWKRYPVAAISDFANSSELPRVNWFGGGMALKERTDMIPMDAHTAVILFPDRLIEWSPGRGEGKIIRAASQTGLTAFHEFERAPDGGAWVAGETGLGHLRLISPGNYNWNENQAPPGYTALSGPVSGAGGEVLVTARDRGGNRAILSLVGDTWTVLFSGGKETLRGWRGPGNTLWIQQKDSLLSKSGDRIEPIDRPEILSANVTDVLSRPDGTFWISTADGVARYAPPLWRTPPAAKEADPTGELVNSIAEDSRHNIWFLASDYLLEKDPADHWTRFPLPAGIQSPPRNTDAIHELADGQIVIGLAADEFLWVFNPETRSFRRAPAPAGEKLGRVISRPGGGVWAQVFTGNGPGWRLETFDGTRFRPDPAYPPLLINDIRAVAESQGDLWLAGITDLARVHNGKVRIFGKNDGFPDSGLFSLFPESDGKLLIGGRDYITEYNHGTFHVLREHVDRVRMIASDPAGLLWFASGKGMQRLNHGIWIDNTIDDGLPANSTSAAFRDSQGRIWAGTTRGLSLYYPGADTDAPRTRIEDSRNLRETPPGGEVRLAFAAEDRWKYTAPERLLFSWRMDGGNWSAFASQPYATFQRLKSGAHRFEARAMDTNGNIDATPPLFQFSVLLPWYRQPLFMTLAVLALLAISFLSQAAVARHRQAVFEGRHDLLTRLPNRRVFEVSLQQAVAKASVETNPVTVLMIDLDRFKPINDSFGHAIGDQFLQEVGRRLGACMRKGDVLARLGGDEFAVVAYANRSEAETMAARILAALSVPCGIDNLQLTCSASIGIALLPDHSFDAATLQRLADMAMYQSKARNRNQYTVFDPHLNRLDFCNAQAAKLIQEALDNGYFRLHYQPIRRPDGAIAAFEALIRLEHPKLGQIQPGDFIPAAESTGLILPVGTWVLQEACRQLAIWRSEGRRDLCISVNVSAIQLSKPDFTEEVMEVLRQTGLPSSALILEITETAMMHNWEVAMTRIRPLRTQGVAVALDDFGTGYSSLNSLHRLPVDYIKIDQALVAQSADSSRVFVILDGIVGIAHELGLKVIAEGIETREQLWPLDAAKCDLLQGFLVGYPVAPDRIDCVIDQDLPQPLSEDLVASPLDSL